MEAVILAGGFGTRLRSVVPDLPKPMAPIGDRPFLEILVSRLASRGFKHVVLSVGYKADVIKSYFGASKYGVALSYAVEDSPLGTGGGIKSALQLCQSDHVYVFNGDTFVDFDEDECERLWGQYGEPVLIARQVEDVGRFGSILVQNGRVTAFKEKGDVGPGLINAGCYVLPRDFLKSVMLSPPFSFEVDVLAPRLPLADLHVLVTHGQFIDIGVPEDYARAQLELRLD